MRILLFSCFLLFSCCAYGQLQPAMVSLQGIGGNGVDQVLSSVTKTADGGFIIGISSNSAAGTGNIDSYCATGGSKIAFLKYNANATAIEWSKCSTSGSYIFPQNNGDFIFGGQTTAASAGWAFKIMRENASGTVLWYKKYGDGASAILRSMIATDDGGYIMLGETNYTDTDVLVHHGSFMDADLWALKVDSNGSKVWSTVIGGTANEAVATIVAASGNGCYIVGTTTSNDFDCTGNHGGDEIYLARLDVDGNILWHKDIGGSGGENGANAVADGSGGVIIVGASNSTDGDRTHFPGYGCPIWALQVDSNSNILWNDCYGGGGGNCYANSVCKAVDGSIWIAGVSSYPGAEVNTNYGKDDAWFLHTAGDGGFLSAKVVGGAEHDKGQMIYPLVLL